MINDFLLTGGNDVYFDCAHTCRRQAPLTQQNDRFPVQFTLVPSIALSSPWEFSFIAEQDLFYL